MLELEFQTVHVHVNHLLRLVLTFPPIERSLAWTGAVQRCYHDEVVRKLHSMEARYDVQQYGALSIDPTRYPLYAVRTHGWAVDKPSVLVTGGVHGCETSGVQGAINFLQEAAEAYASTFNIIVAPCVSPWAYETRQRWNSAAVDPNRSFNQEDGKVVAGCSLNLEATTEESTEESRALIELLSSLDVEQWVCHIDLHETSSADADGLQHIKAARDGEEFKLASLPDGFYLVASSQSPQAEWHAAMIDAVRGVTPIASTWTSPPPLTTNCAATRARHRAARAASAIRLVQDGVIALPSPASIGLCTGVTNAEYATTTEAVCGTADAEECTRAQTTAIVAALDHISSRLHLPAAPGTTSSGKGSVAPLSPALRAAQAARAAAQAARVAQTTRAAQAAARAAQAARAAAQAAQAAADASRAAREARERAAAPDVSVE